MVSIFHKEIIDRVHYVELKDNIVNRSDYNFNPWDPI